MEAVSPFLRQIPDSLASLPQAQAPESPPDINDIDLTKASPVEILNRDLTADFADEAFEEN